MTDSTKFPSTIFTGDVKVLEVRASAKFTGRGECVIDGIVYTGKFDDGVPTGEGRYTKNGRTYEGTFNRHGLLDGHGTITHNDSGKIIEGYFKHGEFQGKKLKVVPGIHRFRQENVYYSTIYGNFDSNGIPMGTCPVCNTDMRYAPTVSIQRDTDTGIYE